MKYNFTSLDRLSTSDVDAIVGMQHYFIDDLTLDVNHFSLSDTFGYVADVGKMLTTRLQHESFADNMAVGFTIGCTNNSRVSLIVNNNKLKSFANTLMYFIFFSCWSQVWGFVVGVGMRDRELKKMQQSLSKEFVLRKKLRAPKIGWVTFLMIRAFRFSYLVCYSF